MTRLDYIKLDIEGGEYSALLSGREVLERFRPIISFEFGKAAAGVYGVGADDFNALFEALDYRVMDIRANAVERIRFGYGAGFVPSWDYIAFPAEAPEGAEAYKSRLSTLVAHRLGFASAPPDLRLEAKSAILEVTIKAIAVTVVNRGATAWPAMPYDNPRGPHADKPMIGQVRMALTWTDGSLKGLAQRAALPSSLLSGESAEVTFELPEGASTPEALKQGSFEITGVMEQIRWFDSEAGGEQRFRVEEGRISRV